MLKYDLVILTDSRFTEPENPDNYIKTVLKEEQLISQALEEYKLNVVRKSWSDAVFNWQETKAVLFRSTWDYFKKFNDFKLWLKALPAEVQIINSSDLIWWNLDKKYLIELEQKGIPIIPTYIINKGSNESLTDLLDFTGWDEAVLKPTVGAGGYHTYHLKKDAIENFTIDFSELIKQQDFMLQPFQKSVPAKGEWSFVLFGDRYSHTVLKKAKTGDFRVQDDFGGTVHTYIPTQKEIDFAVKAVEACPEIPAYARVDVVMDNSGELAVSEVELIEPELWFRHYPEAVSLLTEELLKRLR